MYGSVGGAVEAEVDIRHLGALEALLEGHAVGDGEDGPTVRRVVTAQELGRVVVPGAAHVAVRVDKRIDGACSR